MNINSWFKVLSGSVVQHCPAICEHRTRSSVEPSASERPKVVPRIRVFGLNGPSLAIAMFAIAVPRVFAQSSGLESDGSDGDLNITAPGMNLQSLNTCLNRICSFRSISLAQGATLKLTTKNQHSPVIWLSEGDVRIDGTLDLSGDDSTANGTPRRPTSGGAGGSAGGAGALNGNPLQKGSGLGGGEPGHGGTFTGNKLLVPLVGGSGGGGTDAAGGGGGGALLIYSATSITINGAITANGGNQANPGFPVTGGSGGAIRLVAPVITGSGAVITAKGGKGSGGAAAGGDGWIRIEAFENTLRGDVKGTPLSVGKPFKLFLPTEQSPVVRIISVAGQSVGSNGNSSFDLQRNSISDANPMIVLEAQHVQPGTVVHVHAISETGQDHDADSTPLQGTFELSRATAVLPLSAGRNHIVVDADWTDKAKSAESASKKAK